jgi:hypothetical protein
MRSPSLRGFRLLALSVFLAAGPAAQAPPHALAAQQVPAIRGPASSVSSSYGPAIPLGAVAPGHYLIPSGTGFEIRLASHAANDSLVATFRSAGSFTGAALSGSTAWLAAGTRGLVAVDLSSVGAPAAAGSYGSIGNIRCLGMAPAGQALAAASDSTIHFFRETGPGTLALLESRRYVDGRQFRRIAARGDSFLVAAERPGGIPRLFLTLYRVRAGAAPESLWDFQANGHPARDLAWSGGVAFIADDQQGILPFRLGTRQLRPAMPISGSRPANALDADDSVLVGLVGDRTFARFRRAGSFGDSLVDEENSLLTLQAASEVGLVGTHAIVSTASENAPPEPNEIAQTAIEDHDLQSGVTAPPVGGTGRVRRVVYDSGYAFVADYAGGLRIYRGSGADTALVGVLPPIPNAKTFDLALDTVRRIAYLASGPAGVEVVDVSNPAAPSRLTTVGLLGHALCVAATGSGLVAAGWVTTPGTGGVSMIDVADPTLPVTRGSATIAADLSRIGDPRAIAVRGTIAFVADALSGLFSVEFVDPDRPSILRTASGIIGTRDVDVTGNTLLVATDRNGVQVVDISVPDRPALRGSVPLPAVYGVAQQGTAAIAFLGPLGAVALDLSNPSLPRARGTIEVPGFARDGAWVGDGLLVAATYGLERFTLSPAVPSSPALTLRVDPAAANGRVFIEWFPASLPGLIGLNIRRDVVSAGGGAPGESRRVNAALLGPAETEAIDASVSPGVTYRYSLEGFFLDGSTRELAEGVVSIGSATRVGRPFPNPYRLSSGAPLTIPFAYQPAGGAVAMVSARVYDVGGRHVRGITGPVSPAGGFGAVEWDGRDDRGVPASSGLYYVHIRAPGVDGSCRVVLLR